MSHVRLAEAASVRTSRVSVRIVGVVGVGVGVGVGREHVLAHIRARILVSEEGGELRGRVVRA